ncbi:MAG: SAM-dependent methyltransferase [Mycobacterium sp.]
MKISDDYFDQMYAHADDPWQLATRWYEQRKYAITLSLLPHRRYRHAFEPGCSIGTVTELLTQRCDHVTAVDVAAAALASAATRLEAAGCRSQVSLQRGALDEPWPDGPFDLVVLSEVSYYLDADLLADVLGREIPRLAPGATLLAAHWRHPVDDYPIGGDEVHEILRATPGLVSTGRYRDDDVVIEVFDTGDGASVAAREAVPGAR